MVKFIAFNGNGDKEKRPLVVVDLGYSKSRASCGVTWTGLGRATNHRFSVAIGKVAKGLRKLKQKNPILVIEAPLSWCHTNRGNPTRRGDFENGRLWYCQPGASVCLGAIRFVKQVAELLDGDFEQILIAEAFLSNKPQDGTDHADDARQILDGFWDVNPEKLADNVEPISDLIEGVPSVRVFEYING